MNILQVNKFFWQNAGPERYMFDLTQLLKDRGHDVGFFSMRHERNFDSEYEKYFVSNIDYRSDSLSSRLKAGPRAIAKTVYSLESKRKMRELLSNEKVDLAHLHMISHQISPSILHALRESNVPTIQTVHEYKLICPAYHLYIHHKHEICERCVGGRYYNIFRHKCLKNSILASSLAGIAQYIHKAMQIYEANIDIFITPSRFLAGKLAEGGISRKKIRTLRLYIDLRSFRPKYEAGNYAIYFGRISPEKGILTLLKAMKRVSDFQLLVVGEGPQREELERFSAENGMGNVSFLGYKDGDNLRQLVAQAAFVLLPSEWYENSPLVTYEANALGKPVLASNIGGIPENIEPGETGMLVEPGNVDQLADRIQYLAENKSLCSTMGRNGRQKVERTCAGHYDKLMELYEEAKKKHPR